MTEEEIDRSLRQQVASKLANLGYLLHVTKFRQYIGRIDIKKTYIAHVGEIGSTSFHCCKHRFVQNSIFLGMKYFCTRYPLVISGLQPYKNKVMFLHQIKFSPVAWCTFGQFLDFSNDTFCTGVLYCLRYIFTDYVFARPKPEDTFCNC